MRDIKFRAFTTNNTEVIGLLSKRGDEYFISNKAGSPFAYLVRPETIGQFTGLKDKNGKDVFDGDLKSWKFNNHDWIFLCYWSEMDCGFRWKLVKHNEKQDLSDETEIPFDTEKDFYDYVIKSNQRQHGMDQWSEVIGNIHQDSQLLN